MFQAVGRLYQYPKYQFERISVIISLSIYEFVTLQCNCLLENGTH